MGQGLVVPVHPDVSEGDEVCVVVRPESVRLSCADDGGDGSGRAGGGGVGAGELTGRRGTVLTSSRSSSRTILTRMKAPCKDRKAHV